MGWPKRLGDRVLKYVMAKVDEFNNDRNDVNLEIIQDPAYVGLF